MKTFVVRFVDGTQIAIEAETTDFSQYGSAHWELLVQAKAVARFAVEHVAGIWEASTERRAPDVAIIQG